MRKTNNAATNATVKDAVGTDVETSAGTTGGTAPLVGEGRRDGTSASRTATSSRKAPERQNPDPLFVIFEQHLLNFQDPEIDRKTFIAKVVHDYLGMLRLKNITVPKSLEQPIVEELATQVNAMLVKRIYGSHTIAEFRAKHVKIRRRRSSTAAGRRPSTKTA